MHALLAKCVSLPGAAFRIPDRGRKAPLRPYYTNPVLKNVTITLDPEVAQWARRKAAGENTSVSKQIGRLLESESE